MFPQFLCIGAQKAGSSWLAANLQCHPQIHIPKKEVHYFDADYYLNQSRPDRLRNPQFRKTFAKALSADLTRLRLPKAWWQARYYLGPRSDRWYASLFHPRPGQVCGDITPAYSTLETDVIEHIAELMPGLKVILIMRNPVDRAFSAAKMCVRKGVSGFQDAMGDVNDVNPEAFIRYVREPWVIRRGDYMRMINDWERFFPREQLFYGFMEDIVDRPYGLLCDVSRFLGIDVSRRYFKSERAEKAANAGEGSPMPEKVSRHLSEMYCDEMRQLAAHFSGKERESGYIDGWLEKARATLAEPTARAASLSSPGRGREQAGQA